ncbi:high mobility group B protein 9 isoform X1 [Punica granatum]|uniref:High mobility group B protein 9 isoform X1 n=1 Tax=Punica granatum TaxID=22663 RepID=A0A6P8CE35_PUNGR|nr:high mobility group B protein 9 isoform X1 [Punica granatum]
MLPAAVRGKDGSFRYPAALAPHDAVVRDPAVFLDTLRRFHFLMGTKFMIPVIGRKELDLHVLYVEVTSRGGYEKVVADKKWREVGNVFRFGPTTTSASFVLKKHYMSLLFHYEQVYFFKQQGPPRTPPSVSELSHEPKMLFKDSPSDTKTDCPNCVGPGKAGFSAVGVIDGKFECGYLVSVKLGSEILKGVLFHPVDRSCPTPSVVPQSNALVPYSRKTRHGRMKRWSRRRGDPNYPKPNRSGYNFFFAEKHYKLKSLYPNREREFTKMIGESWNKLSPEERMVYQKIGLKDKERYKRELQEYKEKLMLGKSSEAGMKPNC